MNEELRVKDRLRIFHNEMYGNWLAETEQEHNLRAPEERLYLTEEENT